MNTFKAPYITKAEIDSAASDFTLKYWKDKSSPIDVEKIAEIDLRLNIIPVKNLLNDFGVDAFISRDMKSITIDYDIYDRPVSESRRRFSIAHEIGHLVLHSEVYKSMTFTNPDEWIETVREIPEDQYSFLEFQAYEFAGRLLVPRDQLLKSLALQKEIIATNRLYSRIEDKEALLDYVISKVSRDYKVSKNTIEKRLRSDGIDEYDILGI